MATGRALFWFRRDLSLDDNLAWAAATSDHAQVLPVYVLDRRLLDSAAPFRRAVLGECLRSLDVELTRHGGRLTIVDGEAETAIPRLARDHGATAVVWNADVTRFAQRRDAAVRAALERSGVSVDTAWSTLVHPPGSILTNAGAVPRVFSRFFEQWAAIPHAARLDCGPAEIVAIDRETPPVPSGELSFPVGADAAAARLAEFGRDVDRYDTDRDRPDLAATSRLSVDLKFGAISPRRVAREMKGPNDGRRAFVRQLAWRDWYAHLFHERPDLVDRCQQAVYEGIEWSNDPDDLAAWQEGRTGYPIVDAAMRELAATGWMHNRLRMITASFLVKDLLVDWRAGERHFRRLLLDADVPQNAGNWQWSAGTGPDAAPYFRIFNPVTQAERFDPHGDYVRNWVPELARVAGPAIHAPWKLRPLELAALGVVLGDTYPEPIVDHGAARVRALAVYAAARAEWAARDSNPEPAD